MRKRFCHRHARSGGGRDGKIADGLAYAGHTGMNGITFSVRRKSGDHIRATVVPANRSEQPRFGLLDVAIIAFFVLSAGGLILLLAR